jgi:hypothetical protein
VRIIDGADSARLSVGVAAYDQVAGTTAGNGALVLGGPASFGFLGSLTGSNPAPTAFTLDGTACTVL